MYCYTRVHACAELKKAISEQWCGVVRFAACVRRIEPLQIKRSVPLARPRTIKTDQIDLLLHSPPSTLDAVLEVMDFICVQLYVKDNTTTLRSTTIAKFFAIISLVQYEYDGCGV